MTTLHILDLSHHQGTGTVGQRRATIDMAAVKAAGCAAVIIRTNYGMRIDELASEHNRRADDAGLPRMLYWYPLSRESAAAQARLAFHHGGRVGVRAWEDAEENAGNDGQDPKWPRYSWDYWRHVDDGLRCMDDLTGVLTGLYSSKTYLDHWFSAEQQARWAERFGWWAHYTSLPRPRIPLGWMGKPRPYELWQYAIGRWPGVQTAVDLDYGWPGLTLAELLGVAPIVEPVVETPALALVDELRALVGGA
jgi:GH25 family lysozyme M1 (1,4-beta-N-acetylmuramidase)